MMHALILAICLGAAPARDGQPALVSEEANSFVCGSRCVKRVLEYYGKSAELIDIVCELQGAAIDHPANLADMKRALELRGVHVAGVRIRPTDLYRLEWRSPVIAHFAGRGSTPGHFRVILPSSGNNDVVRVWDGLAGETSLTMSEPSTDATGVVLLTSPSPIGARSRRHSRSDTMLCVGAIALLLPTVFTISTRVIQRRTKK